MSGVRLAEPDPGWPAQFDATAAALRAVLGDTPGAIEHIGSTAVPGLCAKPVLDLMLGVDNLAAVEARTTALAALGYRYRPAYETELPERRYFVRDATGDMPRVHLHAVVRGGVLWRDHLAFRDALRADAALAQRYGELKRALAARHAADKAAYTEAKAPFIRAVLAAGRC
ncbi:GrpB family protein [Roseateles sp. DC23W]|uniref:GrpB family protein n=1 Tax=Pelomonas dachongensis TaxID=3299029 RepID=A0ABW7ENA3_9BURK